ncbi:efflux RND transporter periplasmic adaptor subunit [Planctomicrobium sp. SH668]|uniref:efflux RND transporter periplasmic adaptor subunit n=1 Tax=Planctomicrobium sp. SH668 TaxID=3448126 RepID=UPI003F5B1527
MSQAQVTEPKPLTAKQPGSPSHHNSSSTAEHSKKSSPLKTAFWLLLMTAFGFGGWSYATGKFGQDHRAELPPDVAGDGEEPSSILITTDKVTVRPVKRTVEAVGTLYGYEDLVVSAKAEGRILSIEKEVSERIAPGELLLEIDPTDLELASKQAESNLNVELARLGLKNVVDTQFNIESIPTVILAKEKVDLAQLKLGRIKSLAERQATTQEAVDNVMSEFRMAGAELENQLLIAKASLATIAARQAALAIAQQQLLDTKVRAPTPQRMSPHGDEAKPYIITSRSVSEGTFVRVGDELFRMCIDGTLKLRVAVPERYSSQIRVGQNVDVWTASSDEPFKGLVTMINPGVETRNRAFQVEIQVKNDHAGLKPGAFAKAVIEVENDPEARTVPLSAMIRYAGVMKLFLIENGKAREVQFTPGKQTDDWIEVASPKLPPDAVVATSGQFNLSEGAEVRIRESQPDATASDVKPVSTTPATTEHP